MSTCSLKGAWTNELGSTMVLNQSSDGSLLGCYNTAVGNAKNLYSVAGKTNLHIKDSCEAASLGIVVSWNNDSHGDSSSITTWSGQYQQVDGRERILATWLLTKETAPNDNWSSTRIGTNEFTKVTDENLAMELTTHCFGVDAVVDNSGEL